MLAPRATNEATMLRMNAALNETINAEKFREKLQSLGAEVAIASPKEADSYIANEIEKWREVITSAGISIK